ncbi:MAG: urease accessory UreF family protein [Pseudomonadota bacterium]
MAITTTDAALLRLLQLSSAALPVGAYAFSQGMEAAIEAGWLPDSAATADWLQVQLEQSLAHTDLPLLSRSLAAARACDEHALVHWNDLGLALRETAELRLAELAMGEALLRLLDHLEIPVPLSDRSDTGYITTFAVAASHFEIDTRPALTGFAWSWLENQVAAATKLVPLGQNAAQQILGELLEYLPAAVDTALALEDEHIGASLPGLALASSWHESQYSRLFRS